MGIAGSTLVLGGARAGKSTYAERLAGAQPAPVTYLATCPLIPGDDDLEARIRRHRGARPDDWLTVEEEIDIAEVVAAASGRFVILDCLTTWVANMMHHGRGDEVTLAAVDAAVRSARAAGLAGIAVVSNEVGWGIVPADESTRRYRDLLGLVNQRWAAAVDDAVLLVAGRVLTLDEVATGP